MTEELSRYDRLARVFRALGHATRLCIVKRTAEGGWSVGDLQEQVGCTQPNISQHLAVLRDRGLVVPSRDGNRVSYRLADQRIADILETAQNIFAPEGAVSFHTQHAPSKGGNS